MVGGRLDTVAFSYVLSLSVPLSRSLSLSLSLFFALTNRQQFLGYNLLPQHNTTTAAGIVGIMAFLAQINAGKKLKKVITVDKSAAPGAGRIVGADAPSGGAGGGGSGGGGGGSSAGGGGDGPKLGGIFAGGMPTLRKAGSGTPARLPPGTAKTPPASKPPTSTPAPAPAPAAAPNLGGLFAGGIPALRKAGSGPPPPLSGGKPNFGRPPGPPPSSKPPLSGSKPALPGGKPAGPAGSKPGLPAGKPQFSVASTPSADEDELPPPPPGSPKQQRKTSVPQFSNPPAAPKMPVKSAPPMRSAPAPTPAPLHTPAPLAHVSAPILQAAPAVRNTTAAPARNSQPRRRSLYDLDPPPEQRPLKNFPGASQEANKNLNLARRKHSEMVDKVVAVENDIRMMQERLKKANEEMVALDQLVVFQGTLQEVKRVIQGGLAKLNDV